MTEQQVIEQLTNYRQMQARLQVLASYSVGAGITISRLNQDDQLQELHRRLRGLPSYMYLNKREQRLETVATAYMTKYPAGIKAQLAAVPGRGLDDEDDKLLQELRGKVQKIIAARGYDVRDDIDAVLDRVAELQDLQDEIKRIDNVLDALDRYKPEYARLLRRKYIDGELWNAIAEDMGLAKTAFFRHCSKAVGEYIKLAG